MPTREEIDIEALLVRAYRERQVDRLWMGDPKSQRALSRLIDMGMPAFTSTSLPASRVDTSSYSAKRAARERELMAQIKLTGDPLLRVHDAVLALPDFFVERTDGLDFAVWDREIAEANGHTITIESHGGRCSIQAGNFAPRRLTRLVTTNLVILQARRACRPDPSPVVARPGRAIYDGRKHVVGYETLFDTPLDVVVEERAEYAAWHAALDMLAQTFRVTLPDLAVCRPAAPVCPWSEEPDPATISFGPKKRGGAGFNASQAA